MTTKLSDGFAEDARGITYREIAAPFTGVLVGLFGLLLLIFTAVFSYEIWTWPWHGGKVAGLITVLLFACFIAVVLLFAVASFLPQQLLFDVEAKRIRGVAHGRYWPRQAIDLGFEQLQSPEIKAHDREMQPDVYDIQITSADYLTFKLGSFEKREDAEYWCGRLARLLAAP